jgi:hypothetical protein
VFLLDGRVRSQRQDVNVGTGLVGVLEMRAPRSIPYR